MKLLMADFEAADTIKLYYFKMSLIFMLRKFYISLLSWFVGYRSDLPFCFYTGLNAM